MNRDTRFFGFDFGLNRCAPLRCLVAFTGIVLMHQTRPLWFGSADEFPLVPFASWFIGVPAWCDDVAACAMLLSLATVLLFFRGGKVTTMGTLTFAVSFGIAVLLNQHRLQPWAYEFCVLLLAMALLPSAYAVPCLRLFVASIYLHSGLSKLDMTFLTTHGEAFVSVLANAIGWDFAKTPVELRRIWAAMLPLGEIVVAFGLVVPKTRTLAKRASVIMHLALLWILGPWGLRHQPGVLIWNAFFIAQNLVLFKRQNGETVHSESTATETKPPWRWSSAMGYGLVGAVILLPLLEPFGWFDHWPAWAVYASRPERIRVYVAEHRIADLPAEMQKFVAEDEPPRDALERIFAGKPVLKRIRIDQWSLAVLKAPIYPQDRFQIGVALALAERWQLEHGVRVEIDGYANRWTGERTKIILEDEAQIRAAAGEFLVNALPRSSSRIPVKL